MQFAFLAQEPGPLGAEGDTIAQSALFTLRQPPRSLAAMKPTLPKPWPALVAVAALAGCGPSTPAGLIEEETFVEAYVELRIAALDTDSSRIAAADREAILAAKGITEEDLLEFVRAHSANLEYMREVWNEVELRMDRSPEVADEG